MELLKRLFRKKQKFEWQYYYELPVEELRENAAVIKITAGAYKDVIFGLGNVDFDTQDSVKVYLKFYDCAGRKEKSLLNDKKFSIIVSEIFSSLILSEKEKEDISYEQDGASYSEESVLQRTVYEESDPLS